MRKETEQRLSKETRRNSEVEVVGKGQMPEIVVSSDRCRW